MINPFVRSIGLKLKLIILFIILGFGSGCSEFALLASGASLAGTQNMYVKAYNGVDVLTIMSTEKSMKQHAYEKGKKYIIEGVYDETRSKTLAIIKEKHPKNFMDKTRILE
jgi:hypothetical protein|tara:strand:+ start:1365 stop:1697 length:333 start_codon:yes stop_codon:yes gene_type:complete